jgi:hypothetical protein
MRVFALFDRWTRHKLKRVEDGPPIVPASDEDRSSMADFVRLLMQIDQAENSRAQR